MKGQKTDSDTSEKPPVEELPGQFEPSPRGYVPGVCNLDMKGRIIRGTGALLGFVAVVLYNENWRLLLVHPVLYFLGMVLLSSLTAVAFLQSFLSFCVVDAFLGRVLVGKRLIKVTSDDHQKDRRRAVLVLVSSFLLGLFFSALLLIEELDRSVR
jgi:hypothetical protein